MINFNKLLINYYVLITNLVSDKITQLINNNTLLLRDNYTKLRIKINT